MTDSSTPTPTQTLQGDVPANGFKPGDDTWTQFGNAYRILMGKMTPEGQEQFRKARDDRNEVEDCKRCEDQRDYLLQYSPVIRFLQTSISKLGGEIGSHNIHCRRCEHRASGGFDPEFGIRVCANEIRNQGHLEDTIAHEMVHAYDHVRFKVNWESDLRHAACTEIRASSLSGECRFMREFFTRRQYKFTNQHQECVRRRAALSVQARPSCRDAEHANQVVSEVWDSCFRDTRPFDEIYR